MKPLLFIALLASILLHSPVFAQQPLSFPSEDGLTITADFYPKSSDSGTAATLIVLFHQAGSSRGEYRDIAPRLAEMGYDVLAVDQRSGNRFGGVRNETAAQVDVGRDYVKALPDMRAAINYGRNELQAEQLIIWGSSYSSSLSLVLAGRQSPKVEGVLAFSPGEYFRKKIKVKDEAANIAVPAFITSARSETGQWSGFIDVISSPKTGFIPKGAGKHGSSALLSNDSEEYWQAVSTFLGEYFPVQ